MLPYCFVLKKQNKKKNSFHHYNSYNLGRRVPIYLLTYLSQLPQAWLPLLRPSPWPLTHLTHKPTFKISHFQITYVILKMPPKYFSSAAHHHLKPPFLNLPPTSFSHSSLVQGGCPASHQLLIEV